MSLCFATSCFNWSSVTLRSSSRNFETSDRKKNALDVFMLYANRIFYGQLLRAESTVKGFVDEGGFDAEV